jgi:CBS domain-containing protein
MITKISEILKETGDNIDSVAPNAAVIEAVRVMSQSNRNIGAVLVMDKDQAVGIFTESDCMKRVIFKKRSTEETLVKEVMTSKVVFINADDSVTRAVAIMTENNFRLLPVLDNKKVVGLVRYYDLVKRIVNDQKEMIKGLTEYIELSY